MKVTLKTSLNGVPIDPKSMKQTTYVSDVVSQIIYDVNRRLEKFSTEDNKKAS